jgi:drug/metabolite transporter (DMT)-like permease
MGTNVPRPARGGRGWSATLEAWIPITIAAAFLQNLRSALQRHLKGRLGTTGATYVRFAFGVPFAILYVVGLERLAGLPWPEPNPAFVLYTALGGLAQILGTASLIAAFSYRNFAVGTAYSKTETVQTAIFAVIILGEPIGIAATLAILVALGGVIVLSVARSHLGPAQLVRDLTSPAALLGIGSGAGFGIAATLAILVALGGVIVLSVARSHLGPAQLVRDLTSPAALLGIGSGAGFGIAAVSYRGAALSLGGEGFVMQAAFTLVCVIVFQTVVMTVWIAWREPGQLAAVWEARRVAMWVGLCGMAASAGWFTAMTIQNAALVRALGQIELVFTFAAAHLVFGERSNRREVAGVLLVVAGILILLLGR